MLQLIDEFDVERVGYLHVQEVGEAMTLVEETSNLSRRDVKDGGVDNCYVFR